MTPGKTITLLPITRSSTGESCNSKCSFAFFSLLSYTNTFSFSSLLGYLHFGVYGGSCRTGSWTTVSVSMTLIGRTAGIDEMDYGWQKSMDSTSGGDTHLHLLDFMT